MLRGELFRAFSPELTAERAECQRKLHTFNTVSGISRLERINMWNEYDPFSQLAAIVLTVL